jgi:hypothetical protein
MTISKPFVSQPMMRPSNKAGPDRRVAATSGITKN